MLNPQEYIRFTKNTVYNLIPSGNKLSKLKRVYGNIQYQRKENF